MEKEFVKQIITDNVKRVGNFTSSEIFNLFSTAKDGVSFGAPALTYINKKRMERKMGRSLSMNKGTNSTRWGNFLEQRVHDLLPLGYESIGRITLDHPTISCWKGSPDNVNRAESVTGDTKCYEPENFGWYVDLLSLNDVDLFRKEAKQEYWQLVSNSILLDTKFIEAIVYMPYESELPEINELAYNYPFFDAWKYRFIAEGDKSTLACLPDGGYYKNLNVFRFEVPHSDKDLLTKRVLEAEKLLIK